jgi:hypothetical protein
MDTHPDELSELERRLASRAPASDGLDADAMLFAAGRASVRPRRERFVWAALAAGLAVLCGLLGVQLTAERAKRLSLAKQLSLIEQLQQPPAPRPAPPAPPAEAPPTAEQPPSSHVLTAHPLPRQGFEDWPKPSIIGIDPPGPPSTEPPVLRVGRPDQLPDF